MDPLAPLISSLQNDGRLRVWSMVITVFGDLVQHRGGQISTGRLGGILGRVGVEHGALRTALSRLGRDGWVQSKRIGRASHYRLSDQGIARFASATTRIYAPPRVTPVARWAIAVRLAGSGRQEVILSPEEDATDGGDGGDGVDCLVTGGLQRISEEYRQALMSVPYREALAALATDIAALGDPARLAPLEAVAARVLLVHRWRRIVLRYTELPPELMPADTPLANPRGAVAQAYRALCPAAESWLSAGFDGTPGMPDGNDPLRDRFLGG